MQRSLAYRLGTLVLLGLNFVQEVASLHGGALQMLNRPGGVAACLQLPAD